MRSVFQRIAKELGLRCVLLDRKIVPARSELSAPVIALDDHSEFVNCPWLPDLPDARLLHLIRDPRDVIISAAHYHLTAKEPWLHWRRKEFGGLSYQQAIARQPTDMARYLFEMSNSARNTIEGMRQWDFGRPNALEYKYEELMGESGLPLMEYAFRHLGFEASEIATCVSVFRQSMLSNSPDTDRKGHVRSGVVQQWRMTYNLTLAEAFIAQFGNVLSQLGYEPDNSWAESLPGCVSQSTHGEEVLSGSP